MKNNHEARDRFYSEVGIHLTRESFSVKEQRNGLLPVEWNGAPLCRITAGGGAQFRREELDAEGAGDAFQLATEIAHTTAEYMRLMETSPPLRAKGLDGDYRLLADFNGTVLAGHPTAQGVEFVTWEWDYEHTGMWQGHYYSNNYFWISYKYVYLKSFPKNEFLSQFFVIYAPSEEVEIDYLDVLCNAKTQRYCNTILLIAESNEKIALLKSRITDFLMNLGIDSHYQLICLSKESVLSLLHSSDKVSWFDQQLVDQTTLD